MCFEITFPLTLRFNKENTITFDLQGEDERVRFENGIYYLEGENGSGKSSFLSMLALLSGRVGESNDCQGAIRYGEIAYNDSAFDSFRAAEIREKYFCIFSQEVYFLPGLYTLQNYRLLNGNGTAPHCPESEEPSSLSGGQRQSRFMDIVFQESKPVWFLDEPFNNMDKKNKEKFWRMLRDAWGPSKLAFLIDHTLDCKENGSTRECRIRPNEYSFFDGCRIIETTNESKEEPHMIKVHKIGEPVSFFKEQIELCDQEAQI